MFQQPEEEQADDKQEKVLNGTAVGKMAQVARRLECDQQDRLQLVIGSVFPTLSPCLIISFFTGLRAGFSAE